MTELHGDQGEPETRRERRRRRTRRAFEVLREVFRAVLPFLRKR